MSLFEHEFEFEFGFCILANRFFFTDFFSTQTPLETDSEKNKISVRLVELKTNKSRTAKVKLVPI